MNLNTIIYTVNKQTQALQPALILYVDSQADAVNIAEQLQTEELDTVIIYASDYYSLISQANAFITFLLNTDELMEEHKQAFILSKYMENKIQHKIRLNAMAVGVHKYIREITPYARQVVNTLQRKLFITYVAQVYGLPTAKHMITWLKRYNTDLSGTCHALASKVASAQGQTFLQMRKKEAEQV